MKNIVFIIILFTNIINSYSQYYKNYNWEKQSLLVDSEGNYKNDLEDGKWIYFRENGTIFKELLYDKGHRIN